MELNIKVLVQSLCKKNSLSNDSRKYSASPHEILSRKLNEPHTNAQPFRSLPTRTLCILTPVTCQVKIIHHHEKVVKILLVHDSFFPFSFPLDLKYILATSTFTLIPLERVDSNK